MADPANTDDKTLDGTGQGADAGVEDGNDAFASAFEAFASGGKSEPQDDEEGEGGEAGQPGDDRDGADDAPDDRTDSDLPADAPVKSAAGSEAPDPWAGASPEILAARDAMRADMQKKIDGASGRARGLQLKLNAAQLKPAGIQSADKSDGKGDEPSDAWKLLDDKIKALEDDYPEIAGVLVPLLKQQRDEIATLRTSAAPVIEAAQEDVVAGLQADLEEKHSDWRDYAPGKNVAFDGWVKAQPENVQALAGSWDAREVAVALTLFKTERAEAMRKGQGEGGKPDPKPNTATDVRRQRQLDGGKQVGSRSVSVAHGASEDDFDGAFQHFAAKQSR